MRAVFGLVLLIGIGLAGFAVMQVKAYMDGQNAQLAQQQQIAAQAVQTVEVYSPTRPLTYGEFITPEDVQLIKYAADFLPEGVFTTEEELFPQGVDEPRVVAQPMQVNEPILAAKVTEPGAPIGLTALLDRGTRAYPLQSSITEAFVADLRPGSRLDVFWSGTARGETVTRLLRPSLPVLVVDDSNRVVLQVSPDDFAVLSQAQNSGRLSITPVGDDDDTMADVEETNTATALGLEAIQAPAPVQERRRCFVTQGFGANSQQVEVDCPDE